MIISYYGKKFLKKYNKVEKKKLTPKEFFVNVFYPLFFCNEKPLMRIMNSPFNQDNPKAKKNRQTSEGREVILNEFFTKINNGKIDSCMFVGGYADGLIKATSFNIPTEYNNVIDENEIYYSWIGYALSIYLNGINFLFDNENILYDIYLGWQKYRDLISEKLYDKYGGKEIAKWNTFWLKNKYDKCPDIKFNPFNDTDCYDSNKYFLKSTSWVKLLFNISKKYSNELINSYAYVLDRTNITYGIIQIELKKIDGFLDFCNEYFGDNEFLTRPDLYEKILGTGYSMDKICEFGSIGIVALKPKLLRLEEYQHKNNNEKNELKKLYGEAIQNDFNVKLYNTYLMATLNLKNIEKDVIEIAKLLYKFEDDTRKNNKVLIDKLLSVTNETSFLKATTEMMDICLEENLPQHVEMLKKLTNLVLSDESKLSTVMLLIKFNFQLIQSENKK